MLPRLAVCFVFLQVFSSISAAPVVTPPSSANDTLDCNEEHSEVYDQRQNGTENYRIHVNGVVVLVAPAETVLQAAQLGDLQMLAETEGSSAAPVLKPKPKPPSTSVQVPNQSSPLDTPYTPPKDQSKEKNNNLKLINLLHMFRSIKHDTDGVNDHPHHH